jgi:hypothetical protein
MRHIYVCYLFGFNRGSEWALGENILPKLEPLDYILCASHQLPRKSTKVINGISYVRVNKKIKIIGLPAVLSSPNSPIQYRLDYLIWVIGTYRKLKRRINKNKIQHVNFAQILTPIPYQIRSSTNFTFGPVGGQGPWFRIKFMDPLHRILNFILFAMVYKLFRSRLPNNTIFVHPTLANVFGREEVDPAIRIKKVEDNKSLIKLKNKKITVVHISRKVYFKLPNLHYKLFLDLAKANPDKEFMLIGRGWGRFKSSVQNLTILEHVSRTDVMDIFKHSHYHVNLSLELAGFVNLEAAQNMCITLGAKYTGADLLLSLHDDQVINLYDKEMTYNSILAIISSQIQKYDVGTALVQEKNASRFYI